MTGFDDKTAIGKRLRRLSALIDQDARRLYLSAGVDFEQRWFGVLNLLVKHKAMTVNEIAAELQITHASVSETRRSLEKEKLIQSKADPKDGRQRLLSLTAKGRRLCEQLQPLWRVLEETSDELNDEARNVVAALDRLSVALEKKSLYDRAAEKLAKAR